MKIKDIPENERPVERLLLKGSESLSNEELLSILIKSGTREYSSRELAGMILSCVDGDLNKINMDVLRSIKGIGSTKASVIMAGLELGRRSVKKIDSLNNIKIVDAKTIFLYYKDVFFGKKQEFFYCVYLNSNKIVIKDKLLFMGTLDRSLVHPREVFKEACSVSASSIICVHNHPSGSVIPSRADYDITNRLLELGNMMGIPVIDHIIIGGDRFYSFFENKDI